MSSSDSPFKSGWILGKFNNNDGTDKYITVTKFSTTDSTLISKALSDSNSKVYFADNGGVVSINKTKNFKNGLTNISEPPTFSTNTIVSLPSGDNKYVFSKPNGEWILYRKNDNELSLLYNPVPRPEWDNALRFAETDTFTNMVEACSLVNAADPVCKCIDGRTENPDTNFCMNDLMGNSQTRKAVKQLDGTAYGQLEGVCACSNGSCDRSHPFFKTYRRPASQGGTRECPNNLIVTVCNSSFNAGGNIKSGDVNIQQSCGASTKAPEPSKTTTPPQPVVSQPPQPVVSQPPPQPVIIQPLPQPVVSQPTLQPVISKPTPQPVVSKPTPQPVISKPTPQPVVSQPTPKPLVSQPTPQKSNLMLYLAIGGITLLIFLIILIVVLMK